MSERFIQQDKYCDEVDRALKAIAEGYPYRVEKAYYHLHIVVENPAFVEDDGSAPNLVIVSTLP